LTANTYTEVKTRKKYYTVEVDAEGAESFVFERPVLSEEIPDLYKG
jgi:hypothetical protein